MSKPEPTNGLQGAQSNVGGGSPQSCHPSHADAAMRCDTMHATPCMWECTGMLVPCTGNRSLMPVQILVHMITPGACSTAGSFLTSGFLQGYLQDSCFELPSLQSFACNHLAM